MTVTTPLTPAPNRGRNPPYQYPTPFGSPNQIPKPNPNQINQPGAK